jgi:hypothetical protein
MPDASGLRGSLAIVLLLLLIPSLLAAQEASRRGLVVGAAAGGASGKRTGVFNVYPDGADCGQFNGASSRAAWGEISLGLPSSFSDQFRFGLLLGWQNEAALFTTPAPDAFVILDTVHDVPALIDHEFRYNMSAPLLRLAGRLELDLTREISIAAGPWLGYRSLSAAVQTDRVVGSNYRFPGSLTTQAMVPAGTFTAGFAAGLTLDAAVEIPIGRRLAIRPQVGIDLDLLSPIRPVTSMAYLGRGGLGLTYDLTPEPASAPPPVVPPRPVEPAPPVASGTAAAPVPLHASIDLYGVDDKGKRLPSATVHVFRVLRRSTVPMLTSFGFDRSSASLPARYPQLTRAQAATFAPDSLAGLGLEKISLHSLNILGWRLRENGAARITLRGSSAKGEPSWLAYARMETVRSYLEEAWGIDKNRIDIQPSETRSGSSASSRQTGDRSVSIASTTPGIIDPITVVSVEQTFESPLVRVDPDYGGGAGVKRWDVTLSHEGTVIARYSSENLGTEESSPHWKISDERMASGGSYLVAELSVEDSAGNALQSRSQTPLSFERNLRVVDAVLTPDGRERTLYTLFAADTTSFEARNSDALEEITDAARSASHVSVATVPTSEMRVGTDESARAHLEKVIASELREDTQAHSGRFPMVTDAGSLDTSGFRDLVTSGYHTGALAVIVERDAATGARQ